MNYSMWNRNADELCFICPAFPRGLGFQFIPGKKLDLIWPHADILLLTAKLCLPRLFANMLVAFFKLCRVDHESGFPSRWVALSHSGLDSHQRINQCGLWLIIFLQCQRALHAFSASRIQYYYIYSFLSALLDLRSTWLQEMPCTTSNQLLNQPTSRPCQSTSLPINLPSTKLVKLAIDLFVEQRWTCQSLHRFMSMMQHRVSRSAGTLPVE